MKYLYIIPARGGSKGIPHKNIKLLSGKPLIKYTMDVARYLANDEDICMTSDSDNIIQLVESLGLHVPFKRPKALASDTASSYDTILHAIKYYSEVLDREYDAIVLLQPTSPFRTVSDVSKAVKIFEQNPEVDMVVGAIEAKSNPYYDCFELDKKGCLVQSKGNGQYTRRQDVPKVWEFSGSVYVCRVQSLLKTNMSHFKRITKVEIDVENALDLDTLFDWNLAEMIIENKKAAGLWENI